MMEADTRRPLVIYHGNCPDGFGAALAAWCVYGDSAEYLAVNYGHVPPDVTGRDVFILDFSYPRATLESMHAAAKSLRVIDHHKTAQEDLAGLPYAEFDMEHSGAVLAWEFFHPDCDTPLLLLHIEDRDLWRFKMPRTADISCALWTKPRTFDAWYAIMLNPWPLADEGAAMLAYQERLVDQMSENVRWRAVGPHIVPVVNASCCFSDVGDALCRKFPDAPFTAYWFDRGDGFRQWGLRARGTFDCSEVAERYGGGGHKGAAGWSERAYPEASASRQRGVADCIQDRCENTPFASIGGIACRLAPVLPDYIAGKPISEQDAWLAGYIDEAAILYGEDWHTCQFGWNPVMTIGEEGRK